MKIPQHQARCEKVKKDLLSNLKVLNESKLLVLLFFQTALFTNDFYIIQIENNSLN